MKANTAELLPVVPSLVLKVEEAAFLIRCSKAHLLKVIHGRVPNLPPLPHAKIGRRILIRRESLERWLEAVEASTEGSL